MKLTPEKIAELKALAEDADLSGVDNFTTRLSLLHEMDEARCRAFKEHVPALIADLEEATATRGNGVLVPSPKLKEMQAELVATRKQLAEAQALLVSGADLMRQADSSALQSSIAEAVEPYRKDAERLDWLMLNVNCDEIEALPKLPFGLSREEHLSAFRAAIDAAIATKGETNEQTT